MKRLGRSSIPVLLLLLPMSGPARADDAPPPLWKQVLDNDYYKVSLNTRLRVELADQDGAKASQAYTLRARLGLGTKPLYGFSAFAELESVIAFDEDTYFDVVETPNGETAIADPEDTQLNRLWLQYENPEIAGLRLKAGRQRIIFDDARFVGNVGWRQNEQTFDAALGETTLGIDGLKLTYAWIEEVKRIFGDQSPQKDWDSSSHLANLSYTFGPVLTATAFAYLLRFDNDSPGNSADSYGFRVSGKYPLGGDWSLGYVGSYAWQQDADENPVDYDADYGNVELTLGYAPLGAITAGGELLGSDQGRARFVTPLATAHKFNGFADVFLNNGGNNGLRDAYFAVAPKLPFGISGKLIYHHFWADENGGSLGDELDYVASKTLAKGLVLLSKGAWFNGRARGPADIWRWWLELNYAF